MATSTQALPATGATRTRDGESLLVSTVGRKIVMAASGVVLFGFVLGHMLGNLQVYLGPAALDAYGEALRELLHGTGLWIARAVLLVAVVTHIAAAWSLTRTNWSARPIGYRAVRRRETTYAARTMIWSGPILALFVVFHLLHFTVGSVTLGFRFEPGHVYHNVVGGFSFWPVSLFYVLAMLALGLHMYHGIWSMTQTFGLSHPRYDRMRRAFAAGVTGLVVAGNVSIPLAVLAGIVRQAP
jgi:succinate dehydrogenase / fumarate reductase cytochrome b subunit